MGLGAGLLVEGPSPAAETPADPNRLVLLSDIHIWQFRDGVYRGIRLADQLVQARSEILGLHPAPAAMLISGDCAFREGHAADYQVLCELLQPIRTAGMPLYLGLGNHDQRDVFWKTFPDAKPADKSYPGDRQVAVIETPHANWFVLDSLDQTNVTPGKLGKSQLEWLAHLLDTHDQKPALVVAHHNPELKGAPLSLISHSGLIDSQPLFDVLVPRKHVKAYLFGHTHRWERAMHEGIHLLNIPTLVYVFSVGQPRGWVDARLRSNGMSLQLNALDHTHKSHGETFDLAWR
jgi:3',5'-cyclic AMP phosphodiesterase CpdA